MNRWFTITLSALLALTIVCTGRSVAQGRNSIYRGRGWWHQEWTIDKSGDSIATVHMMPLAKYNRGIDARRHYRLIRTVRKVYPLAQIVRNEMALLVQQRQHGVKVEVLALVTARQPVKDTKVRMLVLAAE